MRDTDAEFTDFVRAQSPALLRTAFYLTGDPGLAEAVPTDRRITHPPVN